MKIVFLILGAFLFLIFISKKPRKKKRIFPSYQTQEISEEEKENIRQKLILSTNFQTMPIMNKSELARLFILTIKTISL